MGDDWHATGKGAGIARGLISFDARKAAIDGIALDAQNGNCAQLTTDY